ncbi:hypothetical protein Pfo_010348 [Paulownia fortunei]|nr:hypothetical protein Pfo_010348 [Paulownia fortunei]
MGSCNQKSNLQRIFQVYLPSIWLLSFFLHPVEATDLDNDYEVIQRRPRYSRSTVTLLGYLVITVSFVICICLRKQVCRQRNGEATEQDQTSITMARKLDISVIESFPVVIFPPPDSRFRFTDCHICLEEFEHGERILMLPACGHAYHKECILRWMATRDSRCPDCRHEYGFV